MRDMITITVLPGVPASSPDSGIWHAPTRAEADTMFEDWMRRSWARAKRSDRAMQIVAAWSYAIPDALSSPAPSGQTPPAAGNESSGGRIFAEVQFHATAATP